MGHHVARNAFAAIFATRSSAVSTAALSSSRLWRVAGVSVASGVPPLTRSCSTSLEGRHPLGFGHTIPLVRHATAPHGIARQCTQALKRHSHTSRNNHFPSILRHRQLQDPFYISTYRSKSDDARPNIGKNNDNQDKAHEQPSPTEPQDARPSNPDQTPHHYHLMDRLPHLHRPTKDELLAAATNFWQRLGVRFKWFSIRSARPFNSDDISAFVSWILFGHILWIILGTTTFVSLAILFMNTVFAQESLAGWVGNYLTQSSGVKVVFESAIVPRWNDGVISFKNVFVSRRPGQGSSNVTKGSSASAAAAAAAASAGKPERKEQQDEDTNYTQYEVSIDTVNVTLSFTKWFNGKGLLEDVEIKGVRGVVDRTSILPGDPTIDPKSYRHEHKTGDFEIGSFKVSDVLLTVYQPNDFRPFSVSIFSCDLPRFRKQWLFYDLMSANMISGSFDDSLFTIHPRQTHSHTGLSISEEDGDHSAWKKHSRLRIDGLNIDHLNRGVEGPFSWIHEGNVDFVADIMFPADQDGSIAKVMSDFYDRMEATVAHNYLHTTHQHDTSDHHDEQEVVPDENDEDKRFIVMDLRVHLNDVRAAVPIFTRDLSYVNNALIRPIVAYINSKRTFIPINCRVVKRVSEFDGSWTVFDSGLLDDLSREVSNYSKLYPGLKLTSRRHTKPSPVILLTMEHAPDD
jgi:distribution and morphology protein 31